MRSLRRVRTGVLVGIAAALALSALPAHAVERFGPARRLPDLDRQCRAMILLTGTPTRAFGACERRDDDGNDWHDRLAYYELTSDGWHGRILSITGRPLAAAQDSTGTYLLVELHRGQGNSAAIVKRDPHGRYSERWLSAEDAVGSGALVVRHGRWWAVWTCVRGSGQEYSLCEAGTLFGSTAARRITDDGGSDFAPSMVLRANGRLDLIWSRSEQTLEGSDEQLLLASNTGNGWTSRTVAARHDYWLFGQLATDGQHLYATWVQNSRPVIASDASGRWISHELPTRSCATGSALAASAGMLILAVNQCAQGDAEQGAQGSAVVVLERRQGRWTSTSLDRSWSQTGLRASSIVAARGRATVLLHSSDVAVTESRSQRD